MAGYPHEISINLFYVGFILVLILSVSNGLLLGLQQLVLDKIDR